MNVIYLELFKYRSLVMRLKTIIQIKEIFSYGFFFSRITKLFEEEKNNEHPIIYLQLLSPNCSLLSAAVVKGSSVMDSW